MRRTIVFLAAVMTAGSLLPGCSGSDDAPTEGSDSITNEMISFPTGTYETTADVDRHAFITFDARGVMDIEYPEGFGYGGSYVVDRNQITITGGGWCQGSDLDLSPRHRYTWTWDGSLLKMTPVGHDGCTDRQVALAEMAPRFLFPTGRYESTDNVTGSDYVFVSFWDGGTMNLGKRESDVGWGSSHGYYIVDRSTIVISDSYCAEQGFETAHYTWKWDGSRLRMKTLTDGCTARKTALAEMTPIVEAPPTPTTSAAVVTESPTALPPESIADASGDALLPVDHLDATSAAVSEQDGVFVFTSTLVESIPASFEPPTPWDAVLWSFCVDTDPSTTPHGYPFNAPTPVPCEFIVTAASEGGAMTGTLIDRRPLLDGKDASTPSIPITVDGTRVSASVPAEQLGSPKRFTWVMAMTVLSLPWPNNDFLDVDEVPDSSFSDPAPWPPAA